MNLPTNENHGTVFLLCDVEHTLKKRNPKINDHEVGLDWHVNIKNNDKEGNLSSAEGMEVLIQRVTFSR